MSKADQRKAAGIRAAVPPEPKRYAQCRNCKNFVYDDNEYLGLKGDLRFRKSNLRCRVHLVSVSMGTVCDAHEFAYTNRSDR